MFKLSNISIGLKLSLMSGLGILLVMALLAAQIMGGAASAKNDAAADNQALIGRGIVETKSSARALQMAVKDIRIARNDEQMQKGVKNLEAGLAAVHQFGEPLLAKFTIPENRANVEKVLSLADQYAKRAKEIVPLKEERFSAETALKKLDAADTGAIARATASVDALDAKQLDVANSTMPTAAEIERLIESTAEHADQARLKAQTESDNMRTFVDRLSLALGLLTALIMGCSAILGAFMIAKPLKGLVKPLEEVAGGNFAITVPGIGRKDEVGQIASAVQLMAEKVSATIGNIKNSGREVTNASAEISTSTTDLSQRTEEQAASLEETSAAMEELSATVRKNAENAQLANTDANMTRDVADRGGKVVAQAVEAMAKIEDSSRKISDIIGVIDEIARQTNLLALNAAVEAARAGEAGRGFAVVASEVRSLAQRSSQAAKDIKDLITNSNGQVKDGVALVNRAGESLTEIVESINKVAAVVADIANASIEQATGIEQINKALTQMDEVTQQNSALVEENAATAKTLEHQAKAMDEQVAFFQIASGAAARETAAAATEIKPARAQVLTPSRGPAAAKPKVAAPVPKRAAVAASGGGARHMQTALATAVNADNDWKEF